MGSAFADLRGNGLPLRERRRRHLIELGVLAEDPDEEEDDVTATEVELVADAEPAPNGLGVPVVVVSEPESPARACQGCGAPLTGRSFQKWCSAKCRKRTVRSAPKAQVAAGSRGTNTLAPAALVAVQADLFAQAMALAAVLPAGGRLEVTAGELCLRWPA